MTSPLRHSAVLLLLLACVAVHAQAASPCLKQTVVVGVADENLSSLTGLTAESFRIEAKDQNAKLLTAVERDLSGGVVILLDMSGSMTDAPRRWPLVLAAAESLVTTLPPETPIALLSFTDTIKDRVEFGWGRQPILNKLAELRRYTRLPKGSRSTALWDTISEALGLLVAAREGDAIVALTDGGDNASKAGLREIRSTLLAQRVRFFSLSPGGVFPGTKEESAGPRELAELAEETGGWSLPQITAKDLEFPQVPRPPRALDLESVTKRSRLIPRSYVLEIELTHEIQKPSKWKLTVLDQRGKKLIPWQVSYPRKLMPCAAAMQR